MQAQAVRTVRTILLALLSAVSMTAADLPTDLPKPPPVADSPIPATEIIQYYQARLTASESREAVRAIEDHWRALCQQSKKALSFGQDGIPKCTTPALLPAPAPTPKPVPAAP